MLKIDVKEMTLEQLVSTYELAKERLDDKDAFKMLIWVSFELKNRNKEAFEKWVASDSFKEESPRKYFM